MESKRVLVVGGSGYLGQHLLTALAAGAALRALLNALPSIRTFCANLRSGDGLEAVSTFFGQVRATPLPIPRAPHSFMAV
ncbi:unnamed protein product [Triticum turgidum subsp. durum]|uniref:Uncharacterized protein n=1 Tax=Triticum turgidum subsp. durum TaxID=4567 RepID=A0A9R1AG25_TRITD|nr:unnamed protein product [Triticum turgidum subsp. durum]